LSEKKGASYVVFARRWRPQTFEDVVGQNAVKVQLQNALKDNRIANAYIFAGPRGVGKTSVARILSKSLNCVEGITPIPCNKCDQCISITNGSSMDVFEIDGASYTGIDDIRDLQEGINRASFSARKKVYIIDEVHMLSINAFNALLKTLEEPPSFVVFIFATTNPEKIPDTIKSRCQILQFERISSKDIMERLDLILSMEEGITVDEKEKTTILEAISVSSEGGMRDAEVALDQLISLSGGNLKFEHVSQLLGLVEFDLLFNTVKDLVNKDVKPLLERVGVMIKKGRDLERFVKTFQGFLRDLLILKAGGGKTITTYSKERMVEIWNLLEGVSLPSLLNYMNNFLSLEERMKSSAHVRFLLEFVFIKLSVIQNNMDIDSIMKSLQQLEKRAAVASPPQNYAPAPLSPPAFQQPQPTYQTSSPPVAMSPPPMPAMSNNIPQRSAYAAESPRIKPLDPETIADHSKLWDKFIQLVNSRKHILEDVLKRCNPRKLENDSYVIETPPGFDEKLLISEDSIKIMQKSLSDLTGRSCKIRVEVNPKLGAASTISTPQTYIPPPRPPSFEESPPLDNDIPPWQEVPLNKAGEQKAESAPHSGDIDVEQYRHLFKDSNVQKQYVLDQLKENKDVKEAVKSVKKIFEAKLTHFDGKSIT
jgi:DNA polymerase III subunit gamma/tau